MKFPEMTELRRYSVFIMCEDLVELNHWVMLVSLTVMWHQFSGHCKDDRSNILYIQRSPTIIEL